jgi:guanylate kinase
MLKQIGVARACVSEPIQRESLAAMLWERPGAMASTHSPSRRGICLILSSPSGAGKTTLARLLLARDDRLGHSVSVTTRRPRPNEREGVDYYFVSRGQFEDLKTGGRLLEWAEVFGNFYGTPAEPVEAALADGRDIVFDVDWQGAASIAGVLPNDTVRVFILPPSGEELSRRIYARASDPEHEIETRLKAAAVEISHWPEYDYVIVNVDLNESMAQLQAIVAAERLKRSRQLGLPEFVSTLTGLGADAAPSAFAERAPGAENPRS